MLKSVEALSDEENHCNEPPQKRARRQSRGFLRKGATQELLSDDPVKLRRLINSKCGCKSNCFQPFRSNQKLYDEWSALRNRFNKMTKLEKDNLVGD